MTSRSLTAQIAEVRREIAMRRKVYPRLVSQRKMNQGEMDELINLMENVLATLEMLQAQRDDASGGTWKHLDN